tara:strand:- start:66 stop:224 length:159 start_codon:yes stop_codon:yes gene_type:complete
MAQAWAGVLALVGIHTGLVNSENFMIVFGAYGAMFVWDKVEKALRPKLQGLK